MLLAWTWKGHRYSVHRSLTQVSWIQAERQCITEGGHLISLHGKEEMAQLRMQLFKIIYRIWDRNKRKMEVSTYQHLYHIGLILQVGPVFHLTHESL